MITDSQHAEMIAQNQQEYAENYDLIQWITDAEADTATQHRNHILKFLNEHVTLGFHDTKLDCTDLSSGCRLCGKGTWSCLFINGKCTCRCFYCPTEQTYIGNPETNGIEFSKPADYLGYIRMFDFQGIGISGGEPLLTLNRTLNYISAIRNHNKENIYIWMYTNGMLLTSDIVLKLQQAGLNEIRFNIAAQGYTLEKVQLAVGKIKVVTVEIPAIPDDIARLKKFIQQASELGINYINLHQLRLTPFNFQHLMKRNYTYLHGPSVTVLESELTALELINYTIEHRIRIPINYCSFAYKNRFQAAGARNRIAPFITKPHENITSNGYIRSLWIESDMHIIEQHIQLAKHHGFSSGWHVDSSMQRLYLHDSLWNFIDVNYCKVYVSYHQSLLKQKLSYTHWFKEVSISKGQRLFIERFPLAERELDASELSELKQIINSIQTDGFQTPDSPLFREIGQFEITPYGLQTYF
ncbi:MAG: 4Fe-4S cluster-binding domain-containing protein [Desulfobacterales bacterium]|nr:4Fe-4S cluster-binding domain-containing protein [Desulfobacterales bacterium]